MRTILIFILVMLIFDSCKKDEKKLQPYQTRPFEITTPTGFPEMIIPEDNLLTQEGVSLGKKLFHDPILSGDNTLSCAGCHLKSSAFSDSNQFSTGINNLQGIRNASAIINAGWHTKFNWDGSANSLEEQAFEPVTNHKEMNEKWVNVEVKLNTHSEYPQLFKNAFNINFIDSIHVVKALAQFERTLISAGNSRYDQYLRNEIQLTPSELNGFAIFNTEKGDCFHCHGTEMFMDNLFHNNALDNEPFIDNGLGDITGDIGDNGKFKTPTLRNIEFSAPYMHDGRFATLEEVLDHYSSGLKQSTTVDPLMKKLHLGGIQLTNKEKEDLISFLKTLSDPEFVTE